MHISSHDSVSYVRNMQYYYYSRVLVEESYIKGHPTVVTDGGLSCAFVQLVVDNFSTTSNQKVNINVSHQSLIIIQLVLYCTHAITSVLILDVEPRSFPRCRVVLVLCHRKPIFTRFHSLGLGIEMPMVECRLINMFNLTCTRP